MKSLDKIRVLDLSRVLAGPVCTQILGDCGADVIKVERPGTGDDTRKWGPPFLKDNNGEDSTESAYYLSANRNKRSITIDITKKEGQLLINDLAAKSDILIHNFKVGGLEKYGLGYDDIHKKHSHLIYCAISGFGQSGPLANEPGYDFLAQALGGLMAITGDRDAPPMKVGVALSDVITGLYCTIGILAALHSREQTGKGQMVDLALLDCTIASLTNIAQYYLTSKTLAPRLGNAHSTIVPYQVFDTKNGHIILAIGNDGQFRRFSEFVEMDWSNDERFATNPARVKYRNELVGQIQEVMRGRTTETWTDSLQKIDVPAGPVNTMDQAFHMDQVQHREMQIQIPHPDTNKPIDLVGSPLKFSDTPVTYQKAPPKCGQHTDEILQEVLELDSSRIKALKSQAII